MRPERAVLPGIGISLVIAIISQWINASVIKGIGAQQSPF